MSKILIWDVETAPLVATTWGLKQPTYLSHGNILRDGYLLCGAWKWHGDPEVHSVSVDPDHAHDYHHYVTDEIPDKAVTIALREALLEADIIVGHNGDKFDSRKLGARVIDWGLDPLPSIRSVDTLKEVRKVAMFTSHRLDFLATRLLDDGGKIGTTYKLWQDCMVGDHEAMATMLTYCERDVTELERIYDYLLPYMRSHPSVTAGKVLPGEAHACPNCGSKNVQKRGKYVTKSYAYQRYACNSCGSWSRDTRITGRGILKTPG